ncbi:hypothetical protein L914_17782, partial [Phytophthora nicotianae]
KTDLVSVRKLRRSRKKRCGRFCRQKKRKRTKKRRRRHGRRTPAFVRDRVPESQQLLEPLLTSWFDVDNLDQATLPSGWSLKRDEKTTFPDIKFKSKFAPSNSIKIMARTFKVVELYDQTALRFHPTFFGFDKNDGIVIHEDLPALTTSVRLQRLREGEYYLIAPRKKASSRSKTER